MLIRLTLSLGLFFGAMVIGFILGQKKIIKAPAAKEMIRFVVKRVSSLILCFSFWRLDFTDRSLFFLPLIGFLVAISTLIPSWLYAKKAGYSNPESGVFITSAVFSNLGFFGAFIAFAIYGEIGYSLASLYMVFFSPTFYALGFSIAKHYGGGRHESSEADAYRDELRLYPFIGILLGFVLSIAKIPRPAFISTINVTLIPIDTLLYMLALGSQLHIEPVTKWLRPCLSISLIKFVYSPLVALGLVYFCGIDGINRFVVLLQAAMPVGVSSLMLALIFDLDQKLASSLWLFTTVLAVPWLLFYLQMIK
jgi:malate permease and related proteins